MAEPQTSTKAQVGWWWKAKAAMLVIALAIVIAGALFYYTGKQFTLSGLDLFFFITTIVSLFLNLWQLNRDQYKYTPLKNSLIGVFNDLKARQLRCYERRIPVATKVQADPNGPAYELYDYIGETIHGYNQLKEHVVSAILTLDPNALTEQIPRATEFGMNEAEKNLAKQGADKFMKAVADQPLPFPPGAGVAPLHQPPKTENNGPKN